MGKAVKAVAVIAISAAIAYFAPGIGLAALHAFGSTAVAGSLAATLAAAVVASVAFTEVSLAMGAIGASPADAPSGYRRGYRRQDFGRFQWIDEPPDDPVPEVLQPISPRHWRWAFFWPGQRFTILRLAGDCMTGSAIDGSRWVLIDRYAPIRPGDVFAFDLDDLWSAYRPEMEFGLLCWRRWATVGMVKRYLGTEPGGGRIIFDCSGPPTLCETGRNRVRYAYRARASSRSWRDCWRARRSILADNSQFDVPLDADRPMALAAIV